MKGREGQNPLRKEPGYRPEHCSACIKVCEHALRDATQVRVNGSVAGTVTDCDGEVTSFVHQSKLIATHMQRRQPSRDG